MNNELAQEEAQREPDSGQRARRGGLLLLVGLLAAGLLYVKAVGVVHQFYQLSLETSVETWSLQMPRGYRLEYWKYTPSSPEGGVRLLPPG